MQKPNPKGNLPVSRPWSDLPMLLCACMAAFPFLVLCATACGQSRPDDEVRALLAKLEAVRGKLANATTKILVEGTYEVRFPGTPNDAPVAQGKFTEVHSGAQAARQSCAMGAAGAMERGFTTEFAWELDPMLGAKAYKGLPERVTRRYFAFFRGASPGELYRDVAKAGTAKLDGVEHVKLKCTPAEGQSDTWFVDPATGNVARIDIALPAPESANATFGMKEETESHLLFADWKVVGGVQFAQRRTLEMGPAKVSYVCTKIEVGAELDEQRLVPPKSVLAIKNKGTDSRPKTADGSPGYEIVEREVQLVATVRTKCKPDEIAATLGVILPEVMGHLSASGGKMAGPPFARYHSFSATEIDIEAGMPVAKPITEKGRVKNSELPAGKAVSTWHIGPYEKLSEAHRALGAHLEANHLVARGGPWEVYWTDPGMVPDPAKWRTQLFIAVEK